MTEKEKVERKLTEKDFRLYTRALDNRLSKGKALEELRMELSRQEGVYNYFTQKVRGKYQLTDRDVVHDDGVIVRRERVEGAEDQLTEEELAEWRKIASEYQEISKKIGVAEREYIAAQGAHEMVADWIAEEYELKATETINMKGEIV